MYYVYMMTNWSNNVLYIGVTNNLLRRTLEHKSKTVQGFTQKYNLHKLVYFEEYSDIEQAIYREKQLKGWTRAKKDSLIDTVNESRRDLYEVLV
jgi:putative endonuclease